MSGFLSQAVGISGALSTLLTSEPGPVVLGDVAFERYEVPERIAFGGQQAMAIHKFPGGARIIDAMGRDDNAIHWRGVMLGPDAEVRARQLEDMRVLGDPQPLSWGAFFYTVVVESLDFDYRMPSHITYYITCAVVRDEAEDASLAQDPTLLQQLSADISNALGVDLGTVYTGAAAALTTAQTAAQAVTILTGGSQAAINIQSALGTASGILTAGSVIANNSLGLLAAGQAATGTAFGATSTPAAITSMGTATQSAIDASNGAMGLAYVGRAVANMSGALP